MGRRALTRHRLSEALQWYQQAKVCFLFVRLLLWGSFDNLLRCEPVLHFFSAGHRDGDAAGRPDAR